MGGPSVCLTLHRCFGHVMGSGCHWLHIQMKQKKLRESKNLLQIISYVVALGAFVFLGRLLENSSAPPRGDKVAE